MERESPTLLRVKIEPEREQVAFVAVQEVLARVVSSEGSVILREVDEAEKDEERA